MTALPAKQHPNHGKETYDKCDDPECYLRAGLRIHPMFHCCRECNRDMHTCRGCGIPVKHGEIGCSECSML